MSRTFAGFLVVAILSGCPRPEQRPLSDVFTSGALTPQSAARVSEAGLQVIRRGDVRYVLGITRDENRGESRRLVASSPEGVAWTRSEGAQERFTDFTVHPSGELTLGIERRADAKDTYDVVRLAADGRELWRQSLPRPTTIPADDLAPDLPPNPFRMKGVQDNSVITGWRPWLQLEARGEGLVVALLTYVDLPDGSLSDSRVISALMALRLEENRYAEDWSRVVDGEHGLLSVAWQYDEFLWLDAATRLLVSVTEDGHVVVGRTLGFTQCMSAVRFGELTEPLCRDIRSRNSAHRYQPFAWTTFSATGTREGSAVLAPAGFEEFVVFDMAARGESVAVAGTAVRLSPSGSPAYYFEPPGNTASTELSPYDGYLATLERGSGAVLRERFIDLGRGELLSSLRWTDEGLLAAGAADWNRWSGGMSVSRAAKPLLIFEPTEGGEVQTRTLEVEGTDRHAFLLGVDEEGGTVTAVGLFDSPMTHSGDGNVALLAFGGLTLDLR